MRLATFSAVLTVFRNCPAASADSIVFEIPAVAADNAALLDASPVSFSYATNGASCRCREIKEQQKGTTGTPDANATFGYAHTYNRGVRKELGNHEPSKYSLDLAENKTT